MTEQELFFRSDGFVADVFVARGDAVQTGDVLAQLEIGELQSQLETRTATGIGRTQPLQSRTGYHRPTCRSTNSTGKLELKLQQARAGFG